MARYRDLQHPGVAPITGVCITVSDDPIVVTHYAQNGDLKSYVRDSNRVSTVIFKAPIKQTTKSLSAKLKKKSSKLFQIGNSKTRGQTM